MIMKNHHDHHYSPFIELKYIPRKSSRNIPTLFQLLLIIDRNAMCNQLRCGDNLWIYVDRR